MISYYLCNHCTELLLTIVIYVILVMISELRRRQDLKYLVVTDDVYLTERLMRNHAVVVLSFMQFSNMF